MGNSDRRTFDVIVVGGGHAGIEAAHAAAKLGANTALITLDANKYGWMPCNPSVGGVGKGHIVFEVSALGGVMPRLCTQSYLQARMLNTSRGQAVRGLRLQIDKYAYAKAARSLLEKTDNLHLLTAKVTSITQDSHGKVTGVVVNNETRLSAQSVVITTGTFLNGTIHIGDQQIKAGRMGEQAVTKLAQFFYESGLHMGRLKTGTPARLAHNSINFSKLEYQEPTELKYLFELNPVKVIHKRACYIARTNPTTHQIIRNHLHLTAQGLGNLHGKPPRYCPSIEDKVTRFAEKESHQIFVEPEDATDQEIYPSGISTSLPHALQQRFINSIEGFESAVITKPGYAIEYDFVFPNQLTHTLETKDIPGLFLAGQINGTTGYEEAAGQGIIAGINAAHKAHDKDSFTLDRTTSYIGVMIDDLVTLGVDEPYRMFTSRADQRLSLRQDNAFARLTPRAHEIGMIGQETWNTFTQQQEAIERAVSCCFEQKQAPRCRKLFESPACNTQELAQFLQGECDVSALHEHALESVHATVRYAPYVLREQQAAKRLKENKALKLPPNFSYAKLPGLSKELQEKLEKYRPETLASAGLVPGITPAALSLLRYEILKRETREKNERKKGR